MTQPQPKQTTLPSYRPMVGWYNVQLLYTGFQSIQQALLRQTDMRVLRGAPPGPPLDARTNQDELWFDYVSDVGDGWVPTYAVACLLARPSLPFGKEELSRGDLLLFGGDLVYPSPGPKEYQERFVQPYTIAFQRAHTEDPSKQPAPHTAQTSGETTALTARATLPREHPRLFAIPGNHDWYDGLFEFTQLFCSRESFGGFSLQQTHSYFALRLPHHWYLFGLDTGLDDDLDAAQLHYFKRTIDQLAEVHANLEAKPRVILCLAVPHWTYAHLYETPLKPRLASLFEHLHARNIAVPLQLSGDLHHYQRYHATPAPRHATQSLQHVLAPTSLPGEAPPDPGTKLSQLALTAGGGGAFLHPTNITPCGPRPSNPETQHLAPALGYRPPRFQPQPASDFPTKKESRTLAGFWPMLRALFSKNLGLFVVMGILYSLWSIPMPPVPPEQSFLDAASEATRLLFREPWRMFWICALIAEGFFFTDTHSKTFRYYASALHMAGHLAGALFANWLTMRAWGVFSPHTPGPWGNVLLFFLNIGPGGLIGALVFFLYLYLSFALAGRHGNEVFSWLQIEDYKNFLRLHIDPTGALHVYTFKVRVRPPKNPTRVQPNNTEPAYMQPQSKAEPHEKLSFSGDHWTVSPQ